MPTAPKVAVIISRFQGLRNYIWRTSLSCYSLRDINDRNITLDERHDSADAAISYGEMEANILFPNTKIYISPSARLYVGREDLAAQWGEKRTGVTIVISVRKSPSGRCNSIIFRFVIRKYSSRPVMIDEIVCDNEYDDPFMALSAGIEEAKMIFPTNIIIKSPVAERLAASWLSIRSNDIN